MRRKCKICKNEFHAKPSHVKRGWSVFCSKKCRDYSLKKGEILMCDSCGKEIYKTPQQIGRSKSKKFFCNKSCQTVWRNKYFSGEKHRLWKGGFATYRDKMLMSGKVRRCVLCKEQDVRVLAVHHVDGDHKNNSIDNLEWLCHNCHYLVHFHEDERSKFEQLRSN